MKTLSPNEYARAKAALDAILDDLPPFTRLPKAHEIANAVRTIHDLRDGWEKAGASDERGRCRLVIETVPGDDLYSEYGSAPSPQRGEWYCGNGVEAVRARLLAALSPEPSNG